MKKLDSLPLEVLQWLMEQFELANEGLASFANDVHLIFDQHLKKHDPVAQIMATPQYSGAIGDLAKMARSNLSDKLRQDQKIRAIWGENWARVAEPCMLEILLLGMTDFVQILVPIRWR